MVAVVLSPGVACADGSPDAMTQTASGSYSLQLETSRYSLKALTYGGRDFRVRAYEGIVYIRNPADARCQYMNIYVPTEYYEGKSVGSCTAATAPIFLPNSVGGYLPSEPDKPGPGMDGYPNASLVAMSLGCVVASPGARGQTTKNASGVYTGKAPACIVDLKAAVRSLRHNDGAIPGNVEKIISNCTSAGGGLSALLGASGDSSDFAPCLAALGAAEERDDIFAASCYCPITNLENADAAHEWLFNGVNDYTRLEISMDTDGHIARTEVSGTLTADQAKPSGPLMVLFPTYLNSLGLTTRSGEALTLDKNGNGSFRSFVKSYVIASAQKAV